MVAAGDGAVALKEVTNRSGKSRMSGAELVRGYRVEAGEILGDFSVLSRK